MSRPGVRKIQIVDSRTGGEPARVVIAGSPELGAGPVAVRGEVFQAEFDRFRSGIVNEPRRVGWFNKTGPFNQGIR